MRVKIPGDHTLRASPYTFMEGIPPGSHGENLRKMTSRSGEGKSLLHDKNLLCEGKDFARASPSWREGILPITPHSNLQGKIQI